MSERQAPRLSDPQRVAWLRLIRSDNVGPSSFRALIERFGSAEAALEALPGLGRNGGKSATRIPSIADIEREIERGESIGVRFVAIGEQDYPPLLRRIDHPPPLIAIKGDGAVLARPAIAIVGGRDASLAGVKMAGTLARDLGAPGYAIVSGLARGIDTAAHRGSLKRGTVAVFAGGLECPYPPENATLADEIVDMGGALISEMPLGFQPKAKEFPRRNRLIAGLSYGLVVIEAAMRSGSLISARLAAEQGRLVFAVPGSPLDRRTEGSNNLLKEGAILVTGVDDITSQIDPLIGRPVVARDQPAAPITDAVDLPADDDRSRLLECLSPTPMDVDEVIRHSGLHPAAAHLILLELDLAGRLERHSGGGISLTVPDA